MWMNVCCLFACRNNRQCHSRRLERGYTHAHAHKLSLWCCCSAARFACSYHCTLVRSFLVINLPNSTRSSNAHHRTHPPRNSFFNFGSEICERASQNVAAPRVLLIASCWVTLLLFLFCSGCVCCCWVYCFFALGNLYARMWVCVYVFRCRRLPPW